MKNGIASVYLTSSRFQREVAGSGCTAVETIVYGNVSYATPSIKPHNFIAKQFFMHLIFNSDLQFSWKNAQKYFCVLFLWILKTIKMIIQRNYRRFLFRFSHQSENYFFLPIRKKCLQKKEYYLTTCIEFTK